jgi:tricorn protease
MRVLPLLVVWTAALAEAGSPFLMQKPALSRTRIAFGYAGDLWTVPREGGEARRLTTGPGIENGPVFSPDGTRIAFTGEYDGNIDVFVVAAAGGVPRRLTWHPAPDRVLGWTPDGNRVLFTSMRTAYSRFAELFAVALDGGLPERLPLPMGYEAAYSPDGSQIAYVPLPRAFSAWKRYRGGQATPVWLARLSDSRIEKVPRENSNDFNPLWIGDRVYFLSDRDGPVTLFSYDPRGKFVKQLIENRGLDLKSAGAGPDAIVYEQFGSLYLYDLKSRKSRPVPVTIAGDLPEVRDRYVNVGKRLGSAHISPTGARALFEARGEVLTVPAEKGDARNLTNTAAVMERDPAWSPDGKSVAWFSDEPGEYELHIRAQTGLGDVQKIRPGDGPGFYFDPAWSPDSKKIAYTDSHMGTWYVDVEAKKPVRVDRDRFQFGDRAPAWSPDSKWLAYTKRLPNYLSAIHLYSVAGGKSTQVTDGMSDARHPVFDRDGKYLYFTASTDAGASMQPDIHSFTRPVSRSVYLLVLAKDQPSPLAPESDEEKAATEAKPGAGEPEKKVDDAKKDETKEPPKPVEVKVDFENILQRVLALPLPPRRYVGLQIGKAGTLYAIEALPFGPGIGEGGQEPPGATVHRFDLAKRKSDVAVGGVRFFEIAQNGEKMLYRQGDRWFIAAPKPMAGNGPAPAPPPQGGPGGAPNALKTDDLQVRASPREEWRQMYREAWRIQRDFFYDPGLHGADLAALQKRYEPYLDNIASRSDLAYLFAEMMGELTVGHLGVFGGDTPEVKRVPCGLLGADYRIENGRYRFARVYNGENWNPQLKAPLTQPGVNVVAGEYLLAVNGREVRATDSVYSFFEATAGKSVLLRVGPDPSGANAREVTVVPVESETGLRNLAWIEDNRRKVDQMTGGRVAYIYMPDTFFGGYTHFNRYFFAQVGKEAAIIDERFNGGGALATDIVEMLNRKIMSAVATRDGEPEVQPQGAIFGPKVMMINEYAGSGGDAMPWYFRRAGTGKLIGKRTWGGLVGRAGAPQLMDGGIVTSPSSGVFNPTSGEWEVENVGIAPDIEVEFDPELVRKGVDPQLEKAVETVLAELEKNPVPKVRRPAYPNYHRSR